MNNKALMLVLSLSPLMASAATPWVKWEGGYVRLEDDGNVACARLGDTRHCNWASTATPAATAKPLVCGAQVKKEWGFTGYDQRNHWCNEVYANYYAAWKLGNFAGATSFLTENPAGDLMCDSADGVNCRWHRPITATAPEKPIRALPCGPVAESLWGNQTTHPDHWCQQARIRVDERNFADPKWAKETFAYEKGWAGTGFGMSGTQRGAPESLRIVEREGRKGLGMMSHTRGSNWFTRYPGTIYGVPDLEVQDDLFMYGNTAWSAADAPVFVMHIYRPKGTTVSLRIPVVHNYQGVEQNRWPGIWLRADGIRMRTVLRDYSIPEPALENAPGRWWTLGLKVTSGGDIEYYAAPDWRETPFEPAMLRGKQSALLGSSAYNVLRQSDATVMVSNVLPEGTEAVIGDISYGLKTEAQKKTP